MQEILPALLSAALLLPLLALLQNGDRIVCNRDLYIWTYFFVREDLPRLRRDLRAAFPEEWAWLRAMPTVVETEHLVFVHGGVPSLEGMEELERLVPPSTLAYLRSAQAD